MIDPLVPAACDLRDFPWTPILRSRLFGSEFHAECNDAEWRAGVTSWLKSWDQVPAGSLPSKEVAQAKLAEVAVGKWRKVRDNALRGYKLATDGRLYHAVLSEVILEAWLEKLGAKLSGGAGNAKRWGTPFDPAPIHAQIDEARRMLLALNPDSKALRKKHVSPGIPTGPKPGPGKPPDGNPDGIPPKDPDGIARELKRSERNFVNRDSGVTPDIPRGMPADVTGKSADEKIPKREPGQKWGDRVWVCATAATLEITQREGEQYVDFRDRVHSAVTAKRRAAA